MKAPQPLLALHGGPDGGPPIAHDFSTNANPLGAPLSLLRALQDTDRQRYPDPQYLALREHLGLAHGLPAEQVLPASGGSEAIRRLSLAALLQGLREVWVPSPGFGDYALAARVLGLAVRSYGPGELPAPEQPALVWVCEPCNPTGASLDAAALQQIAALTGQGHVVVIDQAYEALRLHGEAPAIPPGCWRLQCPNKALGLTGVRAAYLLAPACDALWTRALSLAPSWVLSAEGVMLLTHWHDARTALWLQHTRTQLSLWTAAQREALATLGWEQQASTTHFWLARPIPGSRPLPGDLRERGVKLRDATSLGAPGWWRLAALPPGSQQALLNALKESDPT